MLNALRPLRALGRRRQPPTSDAPRGLGPAFPVRNLKFPIDLDRAPAHWHGAGPAVGRLFDNFSVFFPAGEAFFVQSLKRCAQGLDDPALQAAVRDFCAQEGHHMREHRRYNAFLAAQGLPIEALDARVSALLGYLRRVLPARHQLAITCVLEHFTAILAADVLTDPRMLADCHPALADLWRWHAIEESEHKSVAFEVFTAVGGTWAERAGYMLLVSAIFWSLVVDHQIRFSRADGATGGLRGAPKLLHHVFVTPGNLSRMGPAWLAWFRPGFHPWQHDNRAEIEAMVAQLMSRYPGPQAPAEAA